MQTCRVKNGNRYNAINAPSPVRVPIARTDDESTYAKGDIQARRLHSFFIENPNLCDDILPFSSKQILPRHVPPIAQPRRAVDD